MWTACLVSCLRTHAFASMSDDEGMAAPPADNSDDEDMGGMGDMGDMDMGNPGGGLPEGVIKEVLKEAPDGCWKKPKKGDEVTVHYVGTLAADGSEFDSSRARDKPLVFTLGQGAVIKGWDVGVATMKKGEVAKFTLEPAFAYGEDGSLPKIPASATLVFEIELIGWVSKGDLFKDGGVVTEQLVEGAGWKKPKDGDEVVCSVKATSADGSDTFDERTSFEYVLGSGVLGSMSKAVDEALRSMKKGETLKLTCTKDYAYEEKGGAVVELKLEQMYETTDVSFAKDKSAMKKQIVEGDGYDKPKDAATVTLKVEAATDGTAALPGFEAKTLEILVGNGDVCDALECAVCDMKKGERAVVSYTSPSICVEEQLGLKEISAPKVMFSLELVDFEKAKDTWDMSEEEKLAFGTARKEVGSALFKKGRIHLAAERYKKVMDLFSYVDNFKPENKDVAKELKQICELNRAACQLKQQDFVEAKKSCSNVLKDDSANVKAIFRRAQADFGMKNFEDCIRDLKKLLEKDPQNREARALHKNALAGQKEDDLKSKGMFTKMVVGLGKRKTAAASAKTPAEDVPMGDDAAAASAPAGDAAAANTDAAPTAEGVPS